MMIPTGVAAEPTLLTQALDRPGTDVGGTLTRLSATCRSEPLRLASVC